MHCNDLKYEDIVNFCCIQKSFCSTKVKLFFVLFFFDVGLLWAYFGPLVQKIRIWAVMKSNGLNITRNGFYDPKNPDNMYHT